MDIVKILWTIFNLSVIIILAYILYRVIKTAALRCRHEEEINNKLDELIQLNKKIIDLLSPASTHSGCSSKQDFEQSP